MRNKFMNVSEVFNVSIIRAIIPRVEAEHTSEM
jgi:hypothetical protein